MSKRSTMSSISRFIGMFGSAINVSRAIENRKAPEAHDLRRLGIDPAQFSKIQL